ncbi:hypothetical protein BGX28_009767 [Mortierella sp. GBA30]|nr:hypothetical protein BGX28_009767 [Mortierella sp. GBA30]
MSDTDSSSSASCTKSKHLQKRAVEADAVSNEKARAKHLYSAYESILSSESQLPVFLNHQPPPSSKEKSAKENSKPAAVVKTSDNGSRQTQMNPKDSCKEKAIKNDSNKNQPLTAASPPSSDKQLNLREQRKVGLVQNQKQPQKPQQKDEKPKKEQQKQQQKQQRKSVKIEHAATTKSVSHGPIEDGVPIIQTLFDNVFDVREHGSESLGKDSVWIQEAPLPIDEEPVASPQVLPAAKDKVVDETISRSVMEDTMDDSAPECPVSHSSSSGATGSEDGRGTGTVRKTLDSVKNAIQKVTARFSENDSTTKGQSGNQKPNVVPIISDIKNDKEKTDEKAYDPDNVMNPETSPEFYSQPPLQSHQYASEYIDSESESIFVPFLRRRPISTFDFPGSSLLFTGSAFQRMLASFAFAMSCFLLLILVVSYKMYARRHGTPSPFSFLCYITKGLFISPFTEAPGAMSRNANVTRRSSFAKTPTALLGRAGLKSAFGSGLRSGSGPLLPEPVVASTSSSKAGFIMTDLRRTSASQRQLQQQTEAAQKAYRSYL